MNWLRWNKGLETTPEVIAISGALGLDRFGTAGRLMVVWAWADEMTKDGRITGDVRDFIDELADRPEFANAMIAAGWLRVTDGVTVFPRFGRHNLKTAKQRGLAAERSARYRLRRRHGGRVTNHASTGQDNTRQDKTEDSAAASCAGGMQGGKPLPNPEHPLVQALAAAGIGEPTFDRMLTSLAPYPDAASRIAHLVAEGKGPAKIISDMRAWERIQRAKVQMEKRKPAGRTLAVR